MTPVGPVRPMKWLGQHDHGFAALRRAGRAAIMMPAMFALGDRLIGNADVATFAAFGSFSMLLLVDFGGPIRQRALALVSLAGLGAVFVCLGTLASRPAWLAAVAMGLVSLVVLFVGVVSSVLAGATTAMLLAMILPVSITAPPSAIPDRLAGWALAAAGALAAVTLLWPLPARDSLRSGAATACRALSDRLLADVAARQTLLAAVDAGTSAGALERCRRAALAADAAVAALRRGFLATPYRPTGLTTSARMVVRLVDELSWLDATVMRAAPLPTPVAAGAADSALGRSARAAKTAAAVVLEQSAAVLDGTVVEPSALRAARAGLRTSLQTLESVASVEVPDVEVPDVEIPVGGAPPGGAPPGGAPADDGVNAFVSALNPGFRAHELGFAVASVAANVELARAAEQRGWADRLLGRQPDGVASAAAAARERAAAHLERHSVWLHNSLRGAAGLSLAVLVANLTGVQHSFWVVLGTLSVLRSNALSTGQNVVRIVLGTVAGVVVGALVLALIGTNVTLLWVLLPIAVLMAGVAPAVVSFAAGQAAFTLTLVILYNIIQPAGWRVGLLRVEDIMIGCAISLVVGVLFWPRGAGAALNASLAQAYQASAAYLEATITYGLAHRDRGPGPAAETGPAAGNEPTAAPGLTAVTEPRNEAARSAAAARRLDDTFRTYLAERGTKPVPLAEVSSLVTSVVGLRLAGDAVLALWRRERGSGGQRSAARRELTAIGSRVQSWYDQLAAGLGASAPVPDPLARDDAAEARLVDAVRHDLRGRDGRVSATAVRVIWTADHVDAVRRLQTTLVAPARAAMARRSSTPLERLAPRGLAAGWSRQPGGGPGGGEARPGGPGGAGGAGGPGTPAELDESCRSGRPGRPGRSGRSDRSPAAGPSRNDARASSTRR